MVRGICISGPLEGETLETEFECGIVVVTSEKEFDLYRYNPTKSQFGLFFGRNVPHPQDDPDWYKSRGWEIR